MDDGVCDVVGGGVPEKELETLALAVMEALLLLVEVPVLLPVGEVLLVLLLLCVAVTEDVSEVERVLLPVPEEERVSLPVSEGD